MSVKIDWFTSDIDQQTWEDQIKIRNIGKFVMNLLIVKVDALVKSSQPRALGRPWPTRLVNFAGRQAA